jgi:L-alanine-DL-glutamate epimerase-like enolase superfamily enzyme
MEWTRQVTAALKGEVAGGEQDNQIPVWERMVNDRVVDIVQPDVCYIGGMTRALRVARLAESAKMLCTPHSANLTMVTLFTLHLLRVIPNAGPYLEFSIEPQDQYGKVFDPELRVRDGQAVMPTDEPGWGVTPRQEWLEQAETRTTTVS